MNISKRTWILFGIAIVAILAAFASLYFEKEAEIKTLIDVPAPDHEQAPETAPKKNKKAAPVADTENKETTLTPDNNGQQTDQLK